MSNDRPSGGPSSGLSALGAAFNRRLADPYLFYTATLAPVVVLVAGLSGGQGDVLLALVLSTAAIGFQTLLSLLHDRFARRLAWRLLRLGLPLLYVASAVPLIGGEALPLLALFAPVVAGAAAIGLVEGWTIAAVATLVYLVPQLGSLASSAVVAQRGVTLAAVVILLAFGTRRIVRALQEALREARLATIAERRRSRQIEGLDEISRLLATAGPSEELLADVVRNVSKRFGYPHVSLYLGDGSEVRLVAQHGYAEALPAFDMHTGVAGRVLRTREVAFVSDVSADPDYVAAELRATSLICAPLLVDGMLFGVLNIETSGTRRLDETDRTLVRIIAGRIGVAVALGRDRQALAARADLFRDIERFGHDVSASLAIDSLAALLLDAIGRVVAADILAVTLLDRSAARYFVRAVRGVPDEAVGREILPGEGLAGRAIESRTLVIDDAFTPEKNPASVRALPVPALTHGIGVPLVRDGVVVGALTIGRTRDGADFSELEIEGLQLLARHAALAVANAFLHADVGELAIRDALTGLYNRRHFDEALEHVLARHRRQRLGGSRPVSAIMFDLDRFGAFNKEHGHHVGDAVLRAFAEVLRSRFRESDLVARVGGEEFVVVLEGATRDEAVVAADEVRELLAARRVRGDDGTELQVTVSAGCAELDPADASREGLLRTADVGMFMAKRAGRDRVVAA